MKGNRIMIGIIILAVIVLAFVGYNIYRQPAMFRNLSDESLSEEQVNTLKEKIATKEDKQVLVAYLSQSGTTERVANALSEEIGADIFEIAQETEYSNVYLQSNSQIRNAELPKLSNTVKNIDKYDIIFIGYPVWWHATPAPVNTFIESYDLSNKLIIPFCTSGESDISETMPTFLNSSKGLAVYKGMRINSINQIDTCLSELNLNF
ncbi:flavodoxin [Clostridium tertium]